MPEDLLPINDQCCKKSGHWTPYVTVALVCTLVVLGVVAAYLTYRRAYTFDFADRFVEGSVFLIPDTPESHTLLHRIAPLIIARHRVAVSKSKQLREMGSKNDLSNGVTNERTKTWSALVSLTMLGIRIDLAEEYIISHLSSGEEIPSERACSKFFDMD